MFVNTGLQHANLEDLNLSGCNFTKASLTRALLTGTTAEGVSFSGASLRQAGLAEVVWMDCDLRDVDLRGVAFHLGSTRCGMVDSPYPSHGTRTGFYTDDYYNLSFTAPESIRKAALVGCDLRGANIGNTDFYLVDLRGARFDRKHFAHLVRTGAILD